MSEGTFLRDTIIIQEGSLGVGLTSSPSYKLHVSGNSYIDATSGSPTLLLGRYNGQTTIEAASDDGGYLIMDSSGAGTGRAALNWYSSDHVVLAAGGGNVGIGTASPGSKLHVYGASGATGEIRLESSNGKAFTIGSTGTAYGSANNLIFYDVGASAERMRITSAGELQVTGNGVIKNQESGGNYSYLQQTSSDARLFVQYSQPLLFGTAATERMSIESGGNVKINNKLGVGKSPGVPLDVMQTGDSIKADFTNNVNANFRIKTSGANVQVGPSTASDLEIQTTNTTRLTIESGGNVGIGTAAPTFKLQVLGDVRINSGDAFLNDGQSIRWGGTAAKIDGSSGGDYLRFYTDSIERMRIISGGNVGIGTTSPASKLDIQGSTNSSLILTRTSSGIVSNIEDASGYGALALYQAGGGVKAYITGNGSSYLLGGNVGIGSTSPDSKLVVSGDLRVLGVNHGNSKFGMIGIRKQDGTNALGGIGMHFDTGYENPIIYGYNAGSGYADGNIRFSSMGTGDRSLDTGLTDRMVINMYTGNVGIGTTSPSSTLHVVDGTSGDTVLKVDGTNGTLFSVVDDLSDSLMSVNDSSGLPLFEVFADNHIVAGRYNQNDFYIDTNGNIGIGTSDPSSALDLYEQTGKDNKLRFHSSTTGTGISNGSRIGLNGSELFINNIENDAIKIYTQSTQTNGITIIGSGSVGIGTTSPSQKLHVVGKALITDDVQLTGSNPRIDFNSNGASSLRFYDTTNAAERMRIDTSGNVGIGTTSPGSILSAVGTTGINVSPGASGTYGLSSAINNLISLTMPYASSAATTPNAGARVGIAFRGATSDPNPSSDNNKTAAIYGVSEDAGAGYSRKMGMALYTSAFDATASERVRINADGNVGIGTTSPAKKLHVVDSLSSEIARFESSGNATGGTYTAFYNTSGYLGYFGWGSSSNNNLYIVNSENAPMLFYTNGSEQMRIAASGNVGIGTTSPSRTLDISATGQMTFGGNVIIDGDQGIYWHSDASYGIFRTPGSWTQPNYQQLEIKWITGILLNPGSGLFGKSHVGVLGGVSIGTSYYATEQNNNLIVEGSVGIGTTSPNKKLDVRGDVKLVSTNITQYSTSSNSQSFIRLYNNNGSAKLAEITSYDYSGSIEGGAITLGKNVDNYISISGTSLSGGRIIARNSSAVTTIDLNGSNGTVTATSFSGDGSNLTGISSGSSSNTQSQLSGTTTLTLDVGSYDVHVIPLASGTTISSITYSNVPSSGTVSSILVILKYSGSATVTWTNVRWASNTAPYLTASSNASDVFSLTTYDNGSNWVGNVVATNVSGL